MKRGGTVVDSGKSFGERQFSAQRTPAQFWFDVLSGLVLPLPCIWFDPIVFRSPIGLAGNALVTNAAFGYACLALSWTALLAGLVFDQASRVYSGILIAGAALSCGIGLALLPLSLLGLLALIGAVGFAPFLIAFAFIRNAWRIYDRGQPSGRKAVLTVLAGLVGSVCVSAAIQILVDRQIESAMQEVLGDDSVARIEGLERFKRYKVVASYDRLISRYAREKNALLRERLRLAYRDLTGEEIDRQFSKRGD